MIDKILVMNDSGLSLYEWSPPKGEQDGQLLSGFLTALNAFAQHDRGEQIKKITLDPTTFLFSRARATIFTVLTRNPEFEKVIMLILEEIRDRFVRAYGDKMSDFRGNVSEFKSFDEDVQEILESYVYSEYERVESSFNSDDNIRSILIFSTETGEPLYVKAKEYIDRKSLGFQAPIVTRSAERLINEGMGRNLVDVNIISQRMRSLILRSTAKIQLVEESKLLRSQEAFPPTISERKVAIMLKNSEKLQSITQDPFIIFDQSGRIAYSTLTDRAVNQSAVTIDGLTSYESSRNILSQVFKESIWVNMLRCKDYVHALFDVGKYIALLRMERKGQSEPLTFLRKVRLFQEAFV